MSKTMAVGVVPITDYHCMAVQAAEAFTKMGHGILDPHDFPAGVLGDVKDFWNSVLDEARNRVFGIIPKNPPAAIQNYVYASDVLRRSALEPGGIFLSIEAATETEITLILLGYFIQHFEDIGSRINTEDNGWIWRAAAFFKKFAEMSAE